LKKHQNHAAAAAIKFFPFATTPPGYDLRLGNAFVLRRSGQCVKHLDHLFANFHDSVPLFAAAGNPARNRHIALVGAQLPLNDQRIALGVVVGSPLISGLAFASKVRLDLFLAPLRQLAALREHDFILALCRRARCDEQRSDTDHGEGLFHFQISFDE